MVEQKYIMKNDASISPPEEPLFREHERKEIIRALSPIVEGRRAENLHIYGEEGAGKSFLLSSVSSKLLEEDPDLMVTKIDCRVQDTEYKVLRKLINHLGGDIPKSGYSLTLARELFKKALSESDNMIIVLENIELLLERDGDKLFYFLSRLDSESELPEMAVVTASSRVKEFSGKLSSRTKSSYNYRGIGLRNFKTEEAFEILSSYFENFGLEDHVIAKAIALSRYESEGEVINLKVAMNTLRELVGKYEKPFNAETVEGAYISVQRKRYNFLKGMLSKHEKLLLKAVRRVSRRNKKTWSGVTYEAYRELCEENDIEPHSDRILGDYLTRLSLLGFVDLERYEGGKEGKTRWIKPKRIIVQ